MCKDHEAVNSDKFHFDLRPVMAITDASEESVKCIHCCPHENLPRMVLDILRYSLRYNQSPGGSRIFTLSSLTGEIPFRSG